MVSPPPPRRQSHYSEEGIPDCDVCCIKLFCCCTNPALLSCCTVFLLFSIVVLGLGLFLVRLSCYPIISNSNGPYEICLDGVKWEADFAN